MHSCRYALASGEATLVAIFCIGQFWAAHNNNNNNNNNNDDDDDDDDELLHVKFITGVANKFGFGEEGGVSI